MTTTTLDTPTSVAAPAGAVRGRLASLTASARSSWDAFVTERRAVRALRAQERAFGDLCGSERNDALAAARRG